MRSDSYYATLEWQLQGMVVGHSEHAGRASVAMSPGFNPAARFMTLTTILDADGRERYVGEKTKLVLTDVLRRIAMGEADTTQREIAEHLKVAASTVGRAIRRLMAFGLFGAIFSRGRYGGMTLFERKRGDGLDHFAREAWALIREQAARRLERLLGRLKASGYPDPRSDLNVASYAEQGVGDRKRGMYDPSSLYVRKDATLEFERETRLQERDQRLAQALGIDSSRPQRRVECPAHGGTDRNLAWKWSDRGRLLLKCHSYQCSYEDIRKAVNI